MEQKGKLLKVLKKHEGIFAGKRGNCTGKPVQINLTNDAVSFRYRPYQIHLRIKDQVEKEVYRQCDIGALRQLSAEEVEEREFISPAFAISKRDGVTMRIVFDLRKLNSMLERKQTHMSTIEELIQGIGGFEFASVVDLNMGYLSIPLTESSKNLFTIVFPFGYFECQVLPQGAKPATDFFSQEWLVCLRVCGKTDHIHIWMIYSS